MAKIGKSLSGSIMIEGKPKKTRQGSGKNTKYSNSSANLKRKKSRGQGK